MADRPQITITEARKINGELTEVTYAVPTIRVPTVHGSPLFGAFSVPTTHVGHALVGVDGAALTDAGPRFMPRDALCDAIFEAEHARRKGAES